MLGRRRGGQMSRGKTEMLGKQRRQQAAKERERAKGEEKEWG